MASDGLHGLGSAGKQLHETCQTIDAGSLILVPTVVHAAHCCRCNAVKHNPCCKQNFLTKGTLRMQQQRLPGSQMFPLIQEADL